MAQGLVTFTNPLPGELAKSKVAVNPAAIASCVGAEMAMDMFWSRYSDGDESIQTIANSCYCPVVVLSGS